MYDEVINSVKIVCREREDFTVKFYKESASNPYLLVVSDAFTKGVRNATL